MLSIDETDKPIQRYTWFTVLTNITNDFNSIHTAHKSIVSCQETNVIAHISITYYNLHTSTEKKNTLICATVILTYSKGKVHPRTGHEGAQGE
jgi:hypothetical protein